MGRPKRLYPLGKYRLRTPKVIDKEKAYPIELEYTWNRQIIRKTTNVFVKLRTGIRTVIRDGVRFVLVMVVSLNGSINSCYHVLNV